MIFTLPVLRPIGDGAGDAERHVVVGDEEPGQVGVGAQQRARLGQGLLAVPVRRDGAGAP